MAESAALAPSEEQLEPQGILLYYKYVNLDGKQPEVASFYEDLGAELGQKGRIRVARDGVNVTVGGSMASLHRHIRLVTEHPVLLGADIDFKLQGSSGARNDATQRETKMDTLCVRTCEELVTLGPLARHRADPWVNTATHLSPHQFHDMLARAAAAALAAPAAPAPAAAAPSAAAVTAAAAAVTAAAAVASTPSTSPTGGHGGGEAHAAGADAAPAPAGEGEGCLQAARAPCGAGAADGAPPPVVLLDARNIYETRIGHFGAGPAVPTLDPATRCFSDLPSWIDAHEHLLAHKQVLMYCTGGVRCERASAYLREKGPAFANVFQLRGGIQRYLEAFPDGGFFRGKNFLYDDRIAVGPEAVPAQQAVVGRCLLCARPWDDYGSRLRCSRCRLLLLVCDDCHLAHQAGDQQQDQQQQQHPSPHAATEAAGTGGAAAGAAGDAAEGAAGGAAGPTATVPLLCELCAVSGHGTGTGAHVGASAARPDDPAGAASASATCSTSMPAGAATAGRAGRAKAAGGSAVGRAAGAGGVPGAAAGAAPPRKLRVLCLHGFRQNAKQFQGRTCGLRKRLKDLVEFVFVDAPHVLPHIVKQQQQHQDGGAAGGAGGQCAGRAGGGGALGDSVPSKEAQRQQGGARGCRGHVQAVGAGGAGAQVEAQRPAAQEDEGRDGHPQDEDVGQEGEQGQAGAQEVRPVYHAGAAKRAWLLPPELYPAPSELTPHAQAAEVAAAEAAAGASATGSGVGRACASGANGASSHGAGDDQQRGQQGQQLQHLHPADEDGEAAAAAAAAGGTPPWMDEQQYTRQTCGWDESLALLRRVLAEQGPFDGVFGFSQGASVAAVLCALQQEELQQHLHQQQQQQQAQQPLEQTPSHPQPFRFAVLASGFLPPTPSHRALLDRVGPIPLPSLHVFGSTPGADRQIGTHESDALAAAFALSCGGAGARRVLRHTSGHLIPACKAHVGVWRAFLEGVM